MSDVFQGDEWKYANNFGPPVVLRQRTRAEQQEWLDEQYLRSKITRAEWRFQFDILSLENTDGSLPTTP